MIEPVQSLVTLLLEKDGYFVRSNVRYETPCETTTGRSSAYSDLDIIAIRFDTATGQVTDKIWGEVKAHLTLSLVPSTINGFLDDYTSMLDLTRVIIPPEDQALFHLRQQQAFDIATRELGSGFRRVLYFGGKIPRDGGTAARQLLHRDMEIVYLRDFVRDRINRIGHLDGNNPLCRVLNMLSAYGLTALPEVLDAVVDGAPVPIALTTAPGVRSAAILPTSVAQDAPETAPTG